MPLHYTDEIVQVPSLGVPNSWRNMNQEMFHHLVATHLDMESIPIGQRGSQIRHIKTKDDVQRQRCS